VTSFPAVKGKDLISALRGIGFVAVDDAINQLRFLGTRPASLNLIVRAWTPREAPTKTFSERRELRLVSVN